MREHSSLGASLPRFSTAASLPQIVLGRVGGALGVLGAAGCLAVLAVIIARFDDVGYAFVVRD